MSAIAFDDDRDRNDTAISAPSARVNRSLVPFVVCKQKRVPVRTNIGTLHEVQSRQACRAEQFRNKVPVP
jgi:hypothetical protein